MGRQKRDRKLGKGDPSQAAHAKPQSVASGAIKSDAADESKRRWWRYPLLQGFAIMLGLMAFLWSMFVPRWETNDDCFMSMIAHGYGIAAEASPKLVFSNVLWGHLVQMIPWIGGIPGYSIAAAGSLLLAGTAAGFALRRLNVPLYVVVPSIVLCFTRPLLVCQFTVNAGLLAASGVLCVLSFFRTGGYSTLTAGCALLLLGVLVRFEQAVLVLLVCAPLIPWSKAIRSAPFLTAAGTMAVAVACVIAIDRWQLSSNDWDYFQKFRAVQVPITDYRAGMRLQQSPEVLAQNGLTAEEVAMIQRWGFVGKDIGHPDRLGPALEQLGSTVHPGGALAGAWAGIRSMASSGLVWLTLGGAAVLVVVRQPSLIAAWVLFVGAVAALGSMGRPGVERVYIPMYLALVGGGLAVMGRNSTKQWIGVAIALTVSVFAFAPRLMVSAEGNRQLFTRNRAALRALDDMTIVAWGLWFYYERSYPAWGAVPVSSVRIIGLNPFTYAPYSVAQSDEQAGVGILDRIDSADGALFVATEANFPILEAYLKSRFGWRVVTEEVGAYPLFKVTRVRRIVDPRDRAHVPALRSKHSEPEQRVASSQRCHLVS